ncbi:patatin-like phospholipase family protein [Halalkalibacillus halophilus]|uniref:patatin-like phospholipase family protein n=1 Tax=Halalkalibacillus halophilus TaxID=392827 RepID=UPI000404B443|nr:patatin-like phospholipase family protein [Halalkalibacillus halophilus]
MNVDGVFSGGGVKAYAYLGALSICEEKGIQFKRLAGTSAGALVAALLASGYKASELEKIFTDLQPNQILQESFVNKKIPLIKWMNVYFRLGIYGGDHFEEWLTNVLKKKGVYSFNDLPKDKLHIICTDLTNARISMFPRDLESYYDVSIEDFPVAKAVRMSISIPYIFQPDTILTKRRYKSYLVDGGVLSNFPYWVFSEDEKPLRPIIGMKLAAGSPVLPKKPLNNAVQMLEAITHTMMQAHDARYISEADAKQIIFIPTEGVSATEFDLTDLQKQYLIETGRRKAAAFFKRWQGDLKITQ